MAAIIEAESTLTDRYQTTVPEAVRHALKLGKRDKIHYAIRPNGDIVLTRTPTGAEDPVLAQFLDFLARDIAQHPQQLQTINTGLVRHIQSLIGDMDVALDTPLSADDE